MPIDVPSGADVVLEAFATKFQVTALGAIEPTATVKGVQRRMLMLGHPIGVVDGTIGRNTDYGLLSVQAAEGMDPTGTSDGATQAALAKAFGE